MYVHVCVDMRWACAAHCWKALAEAVITGAYPYSTAMTTDMEPIAWHSLRVCRRRGGKAPKLGC